MRLRHQTQSAVEQHSILTLQTQSLGSGAMRIASAQIVRRGFRLAALLVAARALGPVQFGLYTVVLTVSEIVAMFSGTGYADFLTRETARDGRSSPSLLMALAGIRTAYLCAGIAISVSLLRVLRFESTVIVGTALMGLALLPRTVNELGQGIVRGHQHFTRLIIIEVTQGLVLIVAVGVFVFRGSGVRGLIVAEIVSAIAGAVAATSLCAGLMSGESNSRSLSLSGLFRATFAFNLYPLIVNVYDRADILLLSKLANDAAVGVYSLPYRVFATLQIIPYGLMGALLPRLSRSRWNPECEGMSLSVLRRTYAIALLTILTSMLLARPAVILLLGPRYLGSDIALKILIWAIIPVFFNSVFNTILLALNRERVFLLTATVCTIVNVAANCVLIPMYSYRAAAAVTVVTECVLLAQNLWFIRKALGHVPLPSGMLAATFGFTSVLVAGLALQRVLPEWLVGVAAMLGFVAFLHARGELPSLRKQQEASVLRMEGRP